jgi:cytidine deaminase
MGNGSEDIQELFSLAKEAQKNSYSPYSKFAVGCAVEDFSGKIYTGCNIENASYPACICAERVALAKMVSEGRHFLGRLLVVTSSETPRFPCGFCLQVISEFSGDVKIIAVNNSGTLHRVASIRELYPEAFQELS